MEKLKKETQTLSMPWEDIYGYAQAVKLGATVWISGQLGHDEKGSLAEGMEAQMIQTYSNVKTLLKRYEMDMEDVVEEVIYVTEMSSGIETRGKTGAKVYLNPKRVASTIVEINKLALPGQLVEIKVVAVKQQ
jgi:enamine deaminase RidA (YjgF/YER057c/UK114 family)